jgi:hypothetical protein
MVDVTLNYTHARSHTLNEAKTKLAKLIKRHRTKAKIVAVAAIAFELCVLATRQVAFTKRI